MTILQFPNKLPTPQQLGLPRAQLIGLLHGLAAELATLQVELMKAGNAGEFAAVARKTAGKLAEANSGWNAISDTIRESWGI